MENERDHNTIAFDEDLVGDVSMRPNDVLLASYGRHTKIPGERGGKQPARTGCYRIDDSTVVSHPFKQFLLCPGRNELLSFTLTVDLLKGSRPTTNLHGVRQRCT